jgi:DMSO/TMAO reductase YedYZ molybdopterin-dependent catalytic subunit
MRNKNKVRWLVLASILISIAFLSSCSQVKAGLSPVVTSQTPEATAVAAASSPQISDYRLVVDGLVDNPLSLTYDAILHYPVVSDTLWLVCPGYFETQNEWSGVPVAQILSDAGIKPEAARIKFSSSGGYSQELSIQDAQKEGVFLAYKCDGQVLSENDGYPLRLVAKDQIGAVWVKMLAHIEVK